MRVFVEEQFRLLRVPIAENVQDIRFVKVVLEQLMFVFGLGVEVEACGQASFVRGR
jgi:hypothetical protein